MSQKKTETVSESVSIGTSTTDTSSSASTSVTEGTSKTTSKTTAKKPAAKKAAPAKKKAPTKKAPAKAAEAPAVNTSVKIQFGDTEYDAKTIKAAVEKDCAAKYSKPVKKLAIYIKPEDGAAYYVVNDSFADKIDL